MRRRSGVNSAAIASVEMTIARSELCPVTVRNSCCTSTTLPKYTNATGGGDVFTELSRNSIEQAYAQITSEARNQYTLGYVPKAIASSSAYRDIEVRVLGHGSNLNIYTKAGYYPVPSAR